MIKSLKYKVSLTFDFWTSLTNKPYIVVTAHFVNNEGQLISIVVEFDLIPYPHKSEQVLLKITQIFSDYSLKDKIISITTDNDTTNTKCIRLLKQCHEEYKDILHVRCLAHVLNLVVKKGLDEADSTISTVSKLVKFVTLSPKRKQTYEECCVSLNVKKLDLIKDVPTRWNSTFLMLERAFSMKTVLDFMCSEKIEFNEYAIQDWNNVKLLIDFLQPFYEATVMLSIHEYPSIYYVIPVIDSLLDHMQQFQNVNLLKNSVNAMIAKLNEYSSLIKTDLAEIATILDPRLNNNYFMNKSNTEPLRKLKQIYQNEYYASPSREERIENQEPEIQTRK